MEVEEIDFFSARRRKRSRFLHACNEAGQESAFVCAVGFAARKLEALANFYELRPPRTKKPVAGLFGGREWLSLAGLVFSPYGLNKVNHLDNYEPPDKKVDAQQASNDRLGGSVGKCCLSAARLSQSLCGKMSVHRELL